MPGPVRETRLRQRLSRSQGGLGKGLLSLLSRDRLDEDTWEAIEDTLLTADVGVAPTQALVERRRTRLRGEVHRSRFDGAVSLHTFHGGNARNPTPPRRRFRPMTDGPSRLPMP